MRRRSIAGGEERAPGRREPSGHADPSLGMEDLEKLTARQLAPGGSHMLRTVLRLACAVLLLSFAMISAAAAQPADRRTLFTFSGPVAIPGTTLPAGQYIFRLADPFSGARVVQVLSADGKTAYGQLFSYPAERLEPAATPEVRFMETAKGM